MELNALPFQRAVKLARVLVVKSPPINTPPPSAGARAYATAVLPVVRLLFVSPYVVPSMSGSSTRDGGGGELLGVSDADCSLRDELGLRDALRDELRVTAALCDGLKLALALRDVCV